MERGHEEVAGPAVAVSREDAARAIGAVRGGREADDQQARLWIAETGHGPSPVRLVPKGAPFVAPDLRAVLAQPCAACTRDDRVAYEEQWRRRRTVDHQWLAYRLPIWWP